MAQTYLQKLQQKVHNQSLIRFMQKLTYYEPSLTLKIWRMIVTEKYSLGTKEYCKIISLHLTLENILYTPKLLPITPTYKQYFH